MLLDCVILFYYLTQLELFRFFNFLYCLNKAFFSHSYVFQRCIIIALSITFTLKHRLFARKETRRLQQGLRLAVAQSQM
jgi:hypothetical protein